MSYRQYLPVEDETTDELIRLSEASSVALYKLLGNLTPDELLAKGLSWEEISLISRIRESLR